MSPAETVIAPTMASVEEAEPLSAPAPIQTAHSVRFGRYAVATRPDGTPWEMGHGGMGITYKAYNSDLERIVVLKLIHGAALAQARFKREARLTARLCHPHIATVYDVGSQGGTDYFVLEFIEGENTQVRLRRDGPFAWPVVLQIAAQVALALEAAWRQGIIHRDITPANLMILGGENRAPARPVIKVIDFGLAMLRVPDESPTADWVVTSGSGVRTPSHRWRKCSASYAADRGIPRAAPLPCRVPGTSPRRIARRTASDFGWSWPTRHS